jgi:integrase
MINWCIDKGKFEGSNPTRKVKKIKESRGRERFLEPEEEEKLLAACAEPLRTMLMCGIYAGLRIPSEVLSLKKTSIDLRHGFLTIEGAFAKNGKTETVPLNQKLRDALAKILAQPNKSEYVFVRKSGEPFKSIQNIFRIAAETAGLTDLSPHAMRHTFASRLGELGCDLRTIQELGRWADIRMVQRYDNVNERRKKEAIEKLSGDCQSLDKNPRFKQKSAANASRFQDSLWS